MAKLEVSFSIITSCPSSSSRFQLRRKTFSSLRSHIPNSAATLSVKSPPSSFLVLSICQTRKSRFYLSLAVQEAEVTLEDKAEAVAEESRRGTQRRKLFVLNLPWSLKVTDIKNIFEECGTVSDVEIIKHKDGKNRGFAFVTMGTGEAAQAAIEKLDCREVSGRIIRVQYSRKFKKPRPSPPVSPPSVETHHKLYVSNLAWKVRSSHLKELFAADFKPVSARVVFDSPSGSSAGYGFVSFATREEAEAAISTLDGKELLGRPIRLKFSVRNADRSDDEEEDASPGQSEESVDASDNNEKEVSQSSQLEQS